MGWGWRLPTTYDPWLGWEGEATGRSRANLNRIFLKATPEIEKYNRVLLSINHQLNNPFCLGCNGFILEMIQHPLKNLQTVVLA